MRNGPRHAPGGLRAIVYAVLVHAAIVGVLVIGFNWTSSPPALVTGEPVEAVVVEDPRKLEEARKKAEEQRRLEEQRKKAEAERKQQEELKRKQEEERRIAEQQRLEQERQRQEEEARKKAEEQRRLEEQRKKAEAERKQQDELKRKQEEERRIAEQRRLEEEARRKREEAERQRKVAEEQLRQQLAAEERARAEAARRARAATEAERYHARIQARVYANWSVPVGTPDGARCIVRVRLLASGEVAEAMVIESSGNPTFDRSVEAAIRKASPFPVPQDADVFAYLREFNLDMKKPTQ